MISVKKQLLLFFRVFIVVLSFVIDIKVRADVSINNLIGSVDIEKNGSLITNQTLPMLLSEPLDVQTHRKGLVKFLVNSVHIGLSEKTFMALKTGPDFDFFNGLGYFKTPHFLTLKTPQCEIETDGGEFILNSTDKVTTIWMVAGSLLIKDRATSKQIKLRAGYSTWIGGILVEGKRAQGEIKASDFDFVMNQIKHLSSYNNEEWQYKYDNYRVTWKQAVEDFATETQDKLLDDLRVYSEFKKTEHKRKLAYEEDRAKMRKYYRKKTLELPDENDSGLSEISE